MGRCQERGVVGHPRRRNIHVNRVKNKFRAATPRERYLRFNCNLLPLCQTALPGVAWSMSKMTRVVILYGRGKQRASRNRLSQFC